MNTQTKIILSLAALLIIVKTHATVFTVNNVPTSTIAQYPTIQQAINACDTTGDTVLVHGSPNSYSGFNISNKSIVVIGPGWAPDKNPNYRALISSNINIIGVISSNTEIQGLSLTFPILVGNGSAVPSNLHFIRNSFEGSGYLGLDVANGITFSNYLIEGNVFSESGVAGLSSCVYTGFVIQNNYFKRGSDNFSSFNNVNNSVIIDHNLFYGPVSGSGNVFNNCAKLSITNNIFVRRDAGTSNSNSTFTNNITYHPSTAPGISYDTPWLVNGNNGTGNVANQDPQMVAQTLVNSGTNNPLLDFTISAGQANNSGTDGKDMGLLYDTSGSLNWTNSRNSRLPRVYDFVITNPNIPAGGTLNIQVEGRKSN